MSTQYNPLRSHSERDKRNRRHSYSMRYICQRRPSAQCRSTIDNDHIDRQPAQNWHILYIDTISGGIDGVYRRTRPYTHNRRPTGETIHHLSQRPVIGDGPTSSVTTSPTCTDHFHIIRFTWTFFYVEIYPVKGIHRLGKLGNINITYVAPYTHCHRTHTMERPKQMYCRQQGGESVHYVITAAQTKPTKGIYGKCYIILTKTIFKIFQNLKI